MERLLVEGRGDETGDAALERVPGRLEHGFGGSPPSRGRGSPQRHVALGGNVDHLKTQVLGDLQPEASRSIQEHGLRPVDPDVDARTLRIGESPEHDLGSDARRIPDGDGEGKRGPALQGISIVAQIGSAPPEQAV